MLARYDRAVQLDLASGRFDPLEMGVSTIVVDTTDALAPGYEVVRDFVASPLAAMAE
jgi:hypothetical protein